MSAEDEICRIHPEAVSLEYKTEGSASFDVTAIEGEILASGEILTFAPVS